MKILVIVPAYNESQSIEKTINDLKTFSSGEKKLDLLVVNDGSEDNTGEIAVKSEAMVLNLPYNMGIGSAVQTGYLFAEKYNYDYCLQFDADGQHEAKYISSMIDRLINERASLIIGSRFIEKKGFQSSFFRKQGINLLNLIILLLTGIRITDSTAGFRVTDRAAIKLLASYYPEDYAEPECIVYLNKHKLKIIENPVEMKERLGGKSSINFFRSVYYMLKVPLAMFIVKIRKK